jgi:hypothetical protein
MTKSSSQPSTGDRGWTDAVRFICEAEGLAIPQVTSVDVRDDEISVHLMLPDGRSRISTYPLAALSGVISQPHETLEKGMSGLPHPAHARQLDVA